LSILSINTLLLESILLILSGFQIREFLNQISIVHSTSPQV
jgi:hypothetical protein